MLFRSLRSWPYHLTFQKWRMGACEQHLKQSDEAALQGVGDRFQPVMGPQFLVDVVKVVA